MGQEQLLVRENTDTLTDTSESQESKMMPQGWMRVFADFALVAFAGLLFPLRWHMSRAWVMTNQAPCLQTLDPGKESNAS